jgi:hypothetical protein
VTYYRITCAAIRGHIRKLNPEARPAEDPKARPTLPHMLWMLDQLEHFPNSVHDAVKAGRWIGWVLDAAERMEWWGNTVSRSLIREDRTEGNDVPIVTDAEYAKCLLRPKWRDLTTRRLSKFEDRYWIEMATYAECHTREHPERRDVFRLTKDLAQDLLQCSDRRKVDTRNGRWSEQWEFPAWAE